MLAGIYTSNNCVMILTKELPNLKVKIPCLVDDEFVEKWLDCAKYQYVELLQ